MPHKRKRRTPKTGSTQHPRNPRKRHKKAKPRKSPRKKMVGRRKTSPSRSEKRPSPKLRRKFRKSSSLFLRFQQSKAENRLKSPRGKVVSELERKMRKFMKSGVR